MGWLMAAHISMLAVWSAGLIYVPALCSIDVHRKDRISTQRLRIMTRFAFVGVTSPAAVLTIITGGLLVYATEASGQWLVAKLTVVAMMAIFHGFCGHMLALLGHEGKRKQRLRTLSVWLIAAPVVLIPLVLWLVLAKPVLWL